MTGFHGLVNVTAGASLTLGLNVTLIVDDSLARRSNGALSTAPSALYFVMQPGSVVKCGTTMRGLFAAGKGSRLAGVGTLDCDLRLDGGKMI